MMSFTISSRKLLFLLFFASALSCSVVAFETFNHGQCVTVPTLVWMVYCFNWFEQVRNMYFSCYLFSPNNDLKFVAEIKPYACL